MASQVEFVTPEHPPDSAIAVQVIARTGGAGEIAFPTGHAPFIGSLMTCEVRVTEQSGDIKSFAVRGGFVSVSGTMSETKVTVLSDAAQPADEIDRSVVEAELAEAKATIAANPDDPYAADDLRWAEVRLEAIN
ncbi:MAG: F0F1 ATP synthase subunit epsilon [Actinomycetia bacterium]|nr:F0F1 ATP synthase subunit epsilon [Actinomycetes bacterium]